MPYLVVGVALLALGLISIAGHLALYAGRLPLWALFESLGSILMVGGVLASLTYDDPETPLTSAAATDGEFVLVPRHEWLSWQRLLAGRVQEAERSLSGNAPLPSGTATAAEPPVAGGLRVTSPVSQTPPSGGRGLPDSEGVPYGSGAVHPERPTERSLSLPSPRLELLHEFIERIEKELDALGEERPTPGTPGRPPQTSPSILEGTPGEPPLDPRRAPEVRGPTDPPTRRSVPLPMDPGPSLESGRSGQGTWHPSSPPPSAEGSSLPTPEGPRPSALPVAQKAQASHGEHERLTCAGCGSRFPATGSVTCEACGLPFCRACQDQTRFHGRARLCPLCSMLLREASNE